VLYTSAYWSPKALRLITDEGAIPVGITLYPLRRSYGYNVHTYIRTLAPNRALFKTDDKAIFVPAFNALMESKWHETLPVLTQLMVDAESTGSDVLLFCWENLELEDAWCHRQFVVEFLHEKGFEVEEL
jgi:uncharacterized protein (DUF488 family)